MKKPGQVAGIVEIVSAGKGVVEDMDNRSMAMVDPASWDDHSIEMRRGEGPVNGDVDWTTQGLKKTFLDPNERICESRVANT